MAKEKVKKATVNAPKTGGSSYTRLVDVGDAPAVGGRGFHGSIVS